MNDGIVTERNRKMLLTSVIDNDSVAMVNDGSRVSVSVSYLTEVPDTATIPRIPAPAPGYIYIIKNM